MDRQIEYHGPTDTHGRCHFSLRWIDDYLLFSVVVDDVSSGDGGCPCLEGGAVVVVVDA